jgi:serine/threonine-protein kinase
VDDFYMDEDLVTNHQYVEFLNEVLSRIKVENGVVRGDGEIWMLMGEITKGYEPIIYRDGKFQIQSAGHSACPVLRVTGYGALAYTSFYGKRLLTELEWLYAAQEGKSTAIEAAETAAVLPIPSPVILYRPNAFGIRGLNGNVGEWGSRDAAIASDSKTQDPFVILGGPMGRSDEENALPSVVQRYRWEAFKDVGFRGARSYEQR